MFRKTTIIGIFFVVGAMLYACGGGNETSSSGNVVLFVTDDLSSYKQVITTINKVQIIKEGGAGIKCDVLPASVSLDISNLSSTIQLLNVSSCPSSSYNRIHIEFDKSVKLMDQNNIRATCSFTSYKDDLNQPNSLQCDGNICSLDINGAVNVFANQNNRLGLDFELKDFEVTNFPLANCSVTMKVSPLNDSDLDFKKRRGYKDGISGYVSNLNSTSKTFTIVKGNKTFTVNYSEIAQQNIDQLLQFAFNNNLMVQVESTSFDLNAGRYTASALFVKIFGTISNLNITSHTFTLTYQTNKTIQVDYSSAYTNNRVEGQLSNNMSVEIKTSSFNGINYFAYQVEVKDSETED